MINIVNQKIDKNGNKLEGGKIQIQKQFTNITAAIHDERVLPYWYKFSRGQIFAHFRAEAQFARNCAKISTEFSKFFSGARKFIRAKIF